ncbi:phage baseplate assembly protein V, partial [Flavobacterium sp. DGU38]
YTTNAQSSEEIEEMVKLQTAGSDANSVYYSGMSYFPLGLGQVFSIINQTVEHELIVTEVSHLSQVHGNYTCHFKAIPADVAAPHYIDVNVFAKAETQPAKVKDNNDPEGLGRVKVQFNWAGGNNSSEWLRMIQPHSGSGKGFYFIPEIGEEVLVGFEGDNAQNPYVLGTQYNGSATSGYADGQNNVKAIHTRSGIKFILNDGEGSILIEDPSGNTWKMDGQGNIDVNAPKNLTLNAGENVNITAGKNVSVSAGEDVDVDAGKDVLQSAGNDITMNAGGDINESGDNKTEIIEKAYIRSSLESTNHAEEVTIFSTKENMLLESTSKTVEINSVEKSNFF